MVLSSLRTISNISAAVALAACLAVLTLAQLFPSSLYGGRSAHFELRLLLWWTLAETLAAASNFVYSGTKAEGGGVSPDGHGAMEASVLCTLQGAIMQAAYMSTFIWTLLIVVHRWLTTVRGQRHGEKYEKMYVLLAFLLPIGHSILIWRLGYLGPTDLWCWISSLEHSDAQWVHFHLPYIGIALVLIGLHLSTVRTMRARAAAGQFGSNNMRVPLVASRHSLSAAEPSRSQQHQQQHSLSLILPLSSMNTHRSLTRMDLNSFV